MAGLARAVAAKGISVRYVAEREMSSRRASLGWTAPEFGAAQLILSPTAEVVTKLVDDASENSVHLCEGLRANGLVGIAQGRLAQRGLRQWVIMETVDDAGWRGAVKRWAYARLFRGWASSLEGVLAIGDKTAEWVKAREMPEKMVYPFAYFLPDRAMPRRQRENGSFQVLFVGELVTLKRVDLLIDTIARLGTARATLTIIGTGPEEKRLRRRAARVGLDVSWRGQIPIEAVPDAMARADLLVLPSRYDGWGAVVSEALMAGTPAVCSDRCGATVAVRASGVGGIFPSSDQPALLALLQRLIDAGPLPNAERVALAEWARCLGAQAGARYLLDILSTAHAPAERPVEPWHVNAMTETMSTRCANQKNAQKSEATNPPQ